MEPKTGKRIVSKGTYVKVQGKVLYRWFLVVYMFTIFFVITVFVIWVWYRSRLTALLALLGCGLLGFATLAYWAGRFVLKDIRNIEPVIPLTRASTADLPIPESLVRASSEPLQAQEAVLLRAAQEQETPPEQLVRAVEGPEYG